MTEQVFISYSTDDTASAEQIRAGLEAASIPCWMAPRDIAPGQDYAEQIISAIESCSVLLLVLSESSNRSQYVRNEVERAIAKRKLVIPLRIHDVTPSPSLEFFISNAQWVDAWQVPVATIIGPLVAAIGSHIGTQDTLRSSTQAATQVAPAISERPAQVQIRTAHLPAPTTTLIGRAHDLSQLHAIAAQPNVRLVTLTGPGGTGKTRLALQFAAELADSYSDGVVFIDLAPLTDADQVVATIAQVLGVRELVGTTLVERLREYLQPRHMLLLLDNFEHLLGAAPIVADLLRAAPTLTVLVTSRGVLRLSGEHEYPVPPLDVPPPSGTSQHPNPLVTSTTITQYPAVQLFVERARAAQPAFALTEGNSTAVAEICRRLDGLPLAIELAAARIKLFSAEALLARLNDRLRLLTGGARDLPTRQQALRATIDWSYQLLAPAEQRLFWRLAVFVGGWTLEAAEAVCNQAGDLGTEVIDGLQTLVDHSLVRQEADPDGALRFRRLETIGEYASELLVASGELESLQRQHARFFTTRAEAAEPHLHGAQKRVWIQRLVVEHDNLQAALAWSIEQTDDIGLRLVGALGRFWHFHGDHREGRDWLLRMLERAKNATSADEDRLRAKALNQAGYLALYLHDIPEANTLLEQSVALWRMVGDPYGLARALCDWGAAEFADPNLGRARLKESISLFRQLGDKQGLVRALHWHGHTSAQQGELEDARISAEESIALGRDIGDISNVAASMESVLGYIAFCQGDYAAAQALGEEGLRLYREVDDKPGIALVLGSLGTLAYLQGQFEQAKPLLEERLQIWREFGSQHFVAWSLYALGYLALRQNNVQHAIVLFVEALTLFHALNERHGMARCLAGLAEVAQARGQLERAARLLAATQLLLEANGRLVEYTKWDSADSYSITSQAEFERHVAAVRAALGEAAFDAAWAAGQALTLDQAVEEA